MNVYLKSFKIQRGHGKRSNRKDNKITREVSSK
jgi:ribosomal protein L24E